MFDKATALCDILYKRLRNILTYLLTSCVCGVEQRACVWACGQVKMLVRLSPVSWTRPSHSYWAHVNNWRV